MKPITLLITVVLAVYRPDVTQVLDGTVVMVAFRQPHTFVHVEAM